MGRRGWLLVEMNAYRGEAEGMAATEEGRRGEVKETGSTRELGRGRRPSGSLDRRP